MFFVFSLSLLLFYNFWDLPTNIGFIITTAFGMFRYNYAAYSCKIENNSYNFIFITVDNKKDFCKKHYAI